MRFGFGLSAGLATAAAVAILASAASPQGVTATLDLSGLAGQVQAAQAAAQAAQAAIPQPCGTVPAADTLLGSIGTGACYTRPSDTRPTAVQAALTTTDATGAWSVTWGRPFASANPYINPQAINPSALQPIVCNVTSSTATAASGRCWLQLVMTTPGVATSLINLQLVGIATSIQVRVAGRDLTQ